MVHDKLVKMFNYIGIRVRNEDGTWRTTSEILDDLSDKWLDLDFDIRRSFVYELGMSSNSLYEELVIIDKNGNSIKDKNESVINPNNIYIIPIPNSDKPIKICIESK